MPHSEKIEFRKVRDFSMKINATFEFVKQNFKPLILSLLYIAGPFAVLAGIFSGYYQKNAIDLQSILEGRGYGDDFWTSYMLLILFAVISYVVTVLVVNTYIKLYMESNDDQKIEVQDVWAGVRKYFFKAIMAAILSSVLIMVSGLFFVIPGIYVSVVLSMVFVAIAVEDFEIWEGISRCFTIIKGKWWSTFGLMIVCFIIAGVLGLVFTIPQSVLVIMSGFNNIAALTETEAMPAWYEMALVVTAVIAQLASTLMYVIPLSALAFQYFNLVERRESTGLMQQIESIDKIEDDTEEEGY